MAKFKNSRLLLIAFNVFLLCITSVTVIYAAFTFQRTTEQTFTISQLGTTTCEVVLSSGNVYLADSSGNKTSTVAKIFPGGSFAIPLRLKYEGTLPNGGVTCKTGSLSTAITGYTVQVSGSSYTLTNASTTIGKIFSLAEIRCSGSNVITSSWNSNYYLYLVLNSPAEISGVETAQNFFTNSITSATISFSLKLLTNTTSS
ncbi:MAG: hypothetical protein IKQ31_03280 [Clostridia bacterium]|nr:hypothetical protein [Clostridia bacterium]